MDLKKFGIEKEITTYEYVMWLDTLEGEKFLTSIKTKNSNFGDYWTMHAAKSEIITKYAKTAGK